MTKILILILLFCFGSKAYAQLPELGWSKDQVEKFMEGKNKYNIIDTEQGVDTWAEVFRFAPVSLYGIEGELSITYSESNVVDDVVWRRGEPSNIKWPNRVVKRLTSKLSCKQFLYLANSIPKETGKPDIGKWSVTERRWSINNKAFALVVIKDSSVVYTYWQTEAGEKRKGRNRH